MAVMKDLKIARIKTEEPKKRVEIEICLDLSGKPAELINEGAFKLATKLKTYKLKSPMAGEWVCKINQQY